MLGVYRSKDPVATDKPTSRTARNRQTNTVASAEGNGPKTRSASSRRPKEQQIAVTYLGRPRTASDSEATTGTSRSRRPSPAVIAKKAGSMNLVAAKDEDLSSSSLSSTDSTCLANKSQWTACIDTVNDIGAAAKHENKYIRRLKTMMTRRSASFEKEVAKDERLTLAAVSLLSNRNSWSLNSCHAFLPTIIDNLISTNLKYQSIALNGLEAIADALLDNIRRFATAGATRIGVDVVAEERTAKAKECVGRFREIVQNRDSYYKRMDENSIYKLDNILAQLKNA